MCKIDLINVRWDVDIHKFETQIWDLVNGNSRKITNIRKFQMLERRTANNEHQKRRCIVQFNENHQFYRDCMFKLMKWPQANVWPELDPVFLQELVDVALAE